MPKTLEANLTTEGQAFQIMSEKLGDKGMVMLDEQLTIWNKLNLNPELKSPLKAALQRGETILPKGTLIHGLAYDNAVLRSIATLGVVSGELVGIIEDSETNGCADFFKVPEDMTVSEYLDWSKQSVHNGRIKRKRGEGNYIDRGVAVIVDTQTEGLAPLLEHDAYTDSSMEDFTRLPRGRTSEDTSAILGGVPRGAIAGLVIDARILYGDTNALQEISQIFPALPVFDSTGQKVA